MYSPQLSVELWINLNIFEKAGEANSRNKTYQFWQKDNLLNPKFATLDSPLFKTQRIAGRNITDASQGVSTINYLPHAERCGILQTHRKASIPITINH
jgi:hypothetical protein